MIESNSKEVFLDSEIVLNGSELEVYELPLITPFNLPFGTIETRPSAWLHVSGTVDGVVAEGAAEGTSLPLRIPLYDDFSGNLNDNISKITQEVLNRPLSLREVSKEISSISLGGNYATARMTVEAALIDMAARAQSKSVYEALTGENLNEALAIPYGKSIAENDYDKLVVAGVNAINKGASRLKFKLSPGNHEAVISGIRDLKKEYPASTFMVDANGMFDPDDPKHMDILREVDSLGLMMIEEPVSRAKGASLFGLDAHRRLGEILSLRTPIALDDSITSRETAHVALDEGLGQIINLKPGRVGSFLECLEIAILAKRKQMQIMVGGMLEATPGRTMTLTLAALCLREGFNIPGDVSLPQERISQDLVAPSQQLALDDGGNVIFRPKHGWGYDL